MNPSEKPTEFIEPRKLDSIFATTASGDVLEIPQNELVRVVVSEARIQELGHLPLGVSCAVIDDEDIGGGRHMIPGGEEGTMLGWHWHKQWEFGAFLADDGTFSSESTDIPTATSAPSPLSQRISPDGSQIYKNHGRTLP